MAQAQLRNLNTVVNKFYGGMSTDDYVGASDASGSPMCFYDGSGIDIRSQAKYVTVSHNKPSVDTIGSHGTYGDIVAMIQTALTEQAICTSQGYIFAWDLVQRKHTTAPIVNAFTYNGYGHVIKSDGKIDRWILSDSTPEHDTGVSTGGYTAGYADLGASILFNSPYIIAAGYLYVGSGNKIYKADLSTAGYATITLSNIIDVGFTIKAITQIGDRFYIYASDGTIGIQYLWSGSNVITGGNLSTIRWYDKPIVNVANINNVDYAIVGNPARRSLYRVNGYQPDLLIQSKFIRNDFTSNDKFSFKPDAVNAIETIGNVIYIAGESCIYSWGHITAGLPDSCVREMRFNGQTPTLIQTDPFGQFNLYYFYQDNSSNIVRAAQYIGKQTAGIGTDPGTIIFNPIISSLYSNENGALKVRLGYDLPQKVAGIAQGAINVYYKHDYNGEYTNFYIGTNSTTLPAIGDTYTYNAVTYKVYAVTSQTGNTTNYIIHCTRPDTYTDIQDVNKVATTGTLTKSTGSGPATIAFYRYTDGMQLIGTIDDETTHKELFDVSDSNFQITFMVDLISYSTTSSPRLWDFVYAYQEIENDI